MGRRIAATLKRTAIHAGPTVLGIIVLDFLFLQLMPGDAADVMAIEAGSATAETMAMMRERFGLDQPMLSQLASFLGHLAQFDLGYSPRFNASVLEIIMTRLPNTVLLMATALSFALLLGIRRRLGHGGLGRTLADRVLSVVVLLLYSMPGFWVGLMAIVLFSVKLGWLAERQQHDDRLELHRLGVLADRARISCCRRWRSPRSSSRSMPGCARLDARVQRQDFMRTAHAKGLHPLLIQLRHALRNALIPVTTVAGMHLATCWAAQSWSRRCSAGPAWGGWRSRRCWRATSRCYSVCCCCRRCW
jgi:peptide/nickel transport system permease protein